MDNVQVVVEAVVDEVHVAVVVGGAYDLEKAVDAWVVVEVWMDVVELVGIGADTVKGEAGEEGSAVVGKASPDSVKVVVVKIVFVDTGDGGSFEGLRAGVGVACTGIASVEKVAGVRAGRKMARVEAIVARRTRDVEVDAGTDGGDGGSMEDGIG